MKIKENKGKEAGHGPSLKRPLLFALIRRLSLYNNFFQKKGQHFHVKIYAGTRTQTLDLQAQLL